MRVWIIDGNTYKPEKIAKGHLAYETRRLYEEAKKMRAIRTIEVVNISRLGLLPMPSGDVITLDGLPLRDLPELVISRSVKPYRHKHWLPLLAAFEQAGTCCINTRQALYLTAHKFRMWKTVTAAGIPAPFSMMVDAKTTTEELGDRLGWPVILKHVYGAQGKGVIKCDTPAELEKNLQELRRTHPDMEIKAQKFVPTSRGRDMRVFVAGERVVATMIREATRPGEFRSNTKLGGKGRKHNAPAGTEELAIRTTRALGLQVAGIDLLFGENGMLVCEANKTPGFRALEAACPDINVAREMLRHCLRVTRRHLEKKKAVLTAPAPLELET